MGKSTCKCNVPTVLLLQSMIHFNVCPQVSALAAEVGKVQRERDLVTHTLTDTTAQLQLLTSQNEVC